MRIWFALVLAACGRFEFDATSDVRFADAVGCADPIGHDEDADQIDDVCDVCPQLADDQLDGDGDRVGDACDLAPTQQQRVFFDPFTARRDNDWTYGSSVSFLGDSIALPTVSSNGGLTLSAPPAPAVLETAGRISVVGLGSAQVSLHVFDPNSGIDLYCELYDNALGTGNQLKLTYFDGNAFIAVDSQLIGGPLGGGVFRMQFEYAPPKLRCIAIWNGTRYEASGSDPSSVTYTNVTIAANNLDAELDHFVRLANP